MGILDFFTKPKGDVTEVLNDLDSLTKATRHKFEIIQVVQKVTKEAFLKLSKKKISDAEFNIKNREYTEALRTFRDDIFHLKELVNIVGKSPTSQKSQVYINAVELLQKFNKWQENERSVFK